MALIVVVLAHVPSHTRICGVSSREASSTEPCEMFKVSAGVFLTVVVRVYKDGAVQPTRLHSQAGVMTLTLNAISSALTFG